MLIGRGKAKTLIVFGFTWSKVKVARVTFVRKRSLSEELLNNRALIFHMRIGLGKDVAYLSQSYYISHSDWSWWSYDPYWFWTHYVKCQGHNGHFCEKIFWLIIFRTIYYRHLIFYMLIGLSQDMVSIDFGFTRSKVKVTRALFVKSGSAHFLENYLSQSYHISHVDWSWWKHDPWCF